MNRKVDSDRLKPGLAAGGDSDGWQNAARNLHGFGRQRLWRRCSDAVYLQLLQRLLVPGPCGRILKTDLWDEIYGGGLLPYLKTRARDVFSIDVAQRTVQIARQSQSELKAVTADVRTLPFVSNSFDLIVSNSTLDHFEHKQDLLRALTELARVLEPGGQLLITLDNPSNPIIRLRSLLPMRWLMRLGVVPYYVGTTLSARQLSRALEKNGFRVEQLEAAVHSPRVVMVGLAALLQRWAPLRWQDWLADFQLHFEVMGRWSTRFLTGHYVVVLAVKK